MTNPGYVSATVSVPGDPCTVMTNLVRTTRSDTYLLSETASGWTFAAGRLAEVIVTPSHALLRDHRGGQVVDRDSRPLAEVPRLLEQIDVPDWRAYGVAAFELCSDTERQDRHDGDPVLLHMVVPDVEVRLADGRALVRGTEPAEVTRLADMLGTPVEPVEYRASPVSVEPEPATSYRQAVKDAVEEIRAGRLRKVILSRTVPVDIPVDLCGTFTLGRASNNPSQSFLLSLAGVRAVGFSPETIVEVSPGGTVQTRPVAGTRAFLAQDARRSEQLRVDLLNDAKEVFEHAISVQSAYADLSGICRPDSLAIREFMTVTVRGTVQHLGSTVIGDLAQGQGPWDALAATFPAVTVSGIPRATACEYIRDHEETSRGLYGGAVLTADADGGMEAALILRTLFQRDGRTWLRAGAGIVAQSDPDREFEETCEKLRSVATNIVRQATPGEDQRDKSSDEVVPLNGARLRAEIATMLLLPPEEIDDQQNLIELGLDSVAVMMLASRFYAQGVAVELNELLEEPTIGAWSALLSGPDADGSLASGP